ncbi:MAG: tetratricopeptide repeat protein [Smithella sp.]
MRLDKIQITSKEKILIIYVLLAAMTLAVFWQVNQYGFVFDDVQYVTNNNYVKSGFTWEGIYWAFTNTTSNLWNPLIWLSLMFDYHLFGLNAGGYHMNNLILHILNSFLLFWLFNRITKSIWESAFIAALFAIHPMHVESVAWITERKDVLSSFFFMLTLCLYVYYTEEPNIKRYLLVLTVFVFALMSKPMVVTLPVIMILLDYWPLKRFDSYKGNIILWQMKEKATFFILSLSFAAITIYVMNDPDVQYFPLSSRISNAPVAFITYLGKTFWPKDMAAFYPFPAQRPMWQIIAASLLIIYISITVIVLTKRLPYLLMGWLWFCIMILPVIGLIQNGYYAMADRYHYLPSIGITILLIWSISYLVQGNTRFKKIVTPAGITALAILAVLAWRQSGYWKSSLDLWSHALEVTRDNFVAHNNLGAALNEEKKSREAIHHYNEAIRLKNDYYYAYNNRGNAYAVLGEDHHAIEDYHKAIHLNSHYTEAFYNLGNTYNKLGQYEYAIDNYNKVILMKPDDASAYNNRGNAYNRSGQYQRAIADYNQAIRLNPGNKQTYFNRIHAYFKSGNMIAGCQNSQEMCKLGECKLLEWAKDKGYCN